MAICTQVEETPSLTSSSFEFVEIILFDLHREKYSIFGPNIIYYLCKAIWGNMHCRIIKSEYLVILYITALALAAALVIIITADYNSQTLKEFCISRDISGVSKHSVLILLGTKSKKFPGTSNPVPKWFSFQYKNF